MAENEAVSQNADTAVVIPEDYREFTKFRDAEETTPAASEAKTPQSELAEEASQIAEESDTTDVSQQDADDEDSQETESESGKGNRLSRRIRKLTGTIAELHARLDGLTKESETETEEDQGEVASPPETAEAAPSEKLARPRLADFEDTDELSAWDQYEAAMEEYNDAKTERQVAAALAKQAQDLELQHIQKAAAEAWNKAASRFPDFNEVVREEVKISKAMETVMRMDPDAGTELAYYLGQHPEESERIARASLAANERQWADALARAGMELGVIRAKLAAAKTAPPASPAPKAPAAPPQTKKVTSASKPPTQIRGGVATPSVDVLNPDDASDYRKWQRAREAQLKRK